jgi:hypothetical protein
LTQTLASMQAAIYLLLVVGVVSALGIQDSDLSSCRKNKLYAEYRQLA